MADILIKKTLDEWLDSVDYTALNSGFYKPTKFALKFMNFIKLVNGTEGESHKTPVMHLAMLDKTTGRKKYTVNLVHRGGAKTTLFIEYFNLYLGLFGEIDGFGKLDGMIYVSDSMDNGVKSARKNIEFRWRNSEFLQDWLPEKSQTVNDANIEWHAKDPNTGRDINLFGTKMFGAKTGLRGTKIYGKRPKFAVLDDLLSDDDAKSKVAIQAIKDTIYKGVFPALDPGMRKIVFNGTPFAKDDPIIEAVESGAWHVNVWPVCERFPVDEKDFSGSWEDRFTYEFVKGEHEMAVMSGKLSSFNQEYMLRIASEEERLIQDSEISWYSRQSLLKNRGRYNFYITTDFATSDKETADNSVISVWAYNSNGDWFWVDGIAERQTSEKSIDALFRLAAEYRPVQQVGVEVTGQQLAFIHWLQREMIERNQHFNFAREKNSPGVRPTTNKLSRFNLVVPLFKAGKIFYPEEMKTSKVVQQHMSEIRLATINGLKGKDDCLDTISMLMNLTPWKPTEDTAMTQNDDGVWDEDDNDFDDVSSLESYVV